MEINPTCFTNHLGPWLIESRWFAAALAAVRSSGVKAVAPSSDYERTITPGGVAVQWVNGPMMKGDSKFGGTNTLRARKQLRAYARDPEVKAILLVIDSPGGTVAGTEEFARDVAAAGKPVYAHLDDMGASAAYWIASQAKRITANRTAIVGSLGTMTTLVDETKAQELAGLKVYTVSTGPLKTGPGSPVSEAELAEAQRLVDDLNREFMGAVKAGRGLEKSAVDKLFTGEIWTAPDAKARGLVDAVQSLDDTLVALEAKYGRARTIKAEAMLAVR